MSVSGSGSFMKSFIFMSRSCFYRIQTWQSGIRALLGASWREIFHRSYSGTVRSWYFKISDRSTRTKNQDFSEKNSHQLAPTRGAWTLGPWHIASNTIVRNRLFTGTRLRETLLWVKWGSYKLAKFAAKKIFFREISRKIQKFLIMTSSFIWRCYCLNNILLCPKLTQ